MKVIFLDIDGVLNTSRTFTNIYYEWLNTGEKRVEIDLVKVGYLKEIIDRTNSVIVLSSSWRYFCKKENNKIISNDKKMKELLDIFSKYNISIYDITPNNINGIRENEINSWMTDKEIDSFIIIDDDEEDLRGFEDKLIKTNYMYKENDSGLCEKHINKAIRLLNDIKIKKL